MPVTNSFIEFSRPFIEAAKSVFETMVFSKLEPQRPIIKENNISRGDVSAILGTTGEVTKENGTKVSYKGMIVISWPEDTYIKIASAMLMETYTELTDEISDVGGEICNMIMGNAKRDLSTMGYTTNMAIPSMVQGKAHTLKYPTGTTVILIPINSAHGTFFMELCYKES